MPATVKRGSISTLTDQTNIMLDISDAIDFLSPWDTPFMSRLGKDSLKNPATQVKHEWLEDELSGRSGTISVAYVAGSGTVVLATDQGKYLYPEDVIHLDDIPMQVVAIVGDTLTVTVLDSSVDTAKVSGTSWEKIAHASQEGGAARTDPKKTVVARPFNYTQIIKDWVMLTGTMLVIRRYGYVSERAYQEEKLIKRLAIDLEKSALYGVKSYSDGPPRLSTFGGLYQYVYLDGLANSRANVVNAAGANFDETILNNLLQTIWDAGGSPDFIMVNGTNQRRITDWATPRIRTDRGERTAGAHIGNYESDFGPLNIVLNRWLRPAHIIIGRWDMVGMGPLTGRAFGSRVLPHSSDAVWLEVLGEYTMEVHKPQVEFGWIYNTSTTY